MGKLNGLRFVKVLAEFLTKSECLRKFADTLVVLLPFGVQGSRQQKIKERCHPSGRAASCWLASKAHGSVGPSETGWDLGPGALCCSACTWTNVSSSNKIEGNYEQLKITTCMCSWGKLWTRHKKTQKTQLPLLKSRGRVGNKSRALCTPPAHATTKGVGRTPKPPLLPAPWTHPHPHPT